MSTYRVFRFTFPYPPRLNRAVRVFRGHAVPSPIGKLYKALVRDMVRARLSGTLTGPMRATAHVFRPRASGDLDGHLKVLLDALQEDKKEGWPGLYKNDSKFFRLEVEHWDTEPENPRIQFELVEDPSARHPPAAWTLRPGEAQAMVSAQARMAELNAKDLARDKARAAKRSAPGLPLGKNTAAQLARPASYPPRGRGKKT